MDDKGSINTSRLTYSDLISHQISWFIDQISPIFRWFILLAIAGFLLSYFFKGQVDVLLIPLTNLIKSDYSGSQLLFSFSCSLFVIGPIFALLTMCVKLAWKVISPIFSFIIKLIGTIFSPIIGLVQRFLPESIKSFFSKFSKQFFRTTYLDWISSPKDNSKTIEVNNYVRSIGSSITVIKSDNYWRAGIEVNFTNGRQFTFHLFEDDAGNELGKIKWLAALDGSIIQFKHKPEIDSVNKISIQIVIHDGLIESFVDEDKVFSLDPAIENMRVKSINLKSWDDGRDKIEVQFSQISIVTRDGK